MAPHVASAADVFNLFVGESLLMFDCSGRDTVMPGSVRVEVGGSASAADAARAAHEFAQDEVAPDREDHAIVLAGEDAAFSDGVVRWLADPSGGKCTRVLLASRADVEAAFPFLFGVESHADLPFLPSVVTPGKLLLGSRACTAERSLQLMGVTHVLSVISHELELPAGASARHLLLHIDDADEAELTPVLERALPFLEDARASGGVALVHCDRGASRSVAVVVAHLIASGEHASVDDALAAVRACRASAAPNAGFMRQLNEFAQRHQKL